MYTLSTVAWHAFGYRIRRLLKINKKQANDPNTECASWETHFRDCSESFSFWCRSGGVRGHCSLSDIKLLALVRMTKIFLLKTSWASLTSTPSGANLLRNFIHLFHIFIVFLSSFSLYFESKIGVTCWRPSWTKIGFERATWFDIWWYRK